MSDDRDEFSPDEERDLLAAEYALGLLRGEELLAARGRFGSDPAFAAAVEAWERRFAPMFAGYAEAAPPPDVWQRIESEIRAGRETGGDVVELRRAARRWRGVAGGASALAAALALVLALRIAQPDAPVPPPQTEQPTPSALLAASLASEDRTAALGVTIDASTGMLIVTPTRMDPAPDHSHELWLLPPGRDPVSLGIVRAGAPQRLPLPQGLAAAVTTEAQVALSVEPAGGSPTGLPTGPVIASAPLSRI